MQTNNQYFYRGMLEELEKRAIISANPDVPQIHPPPIKAPAPVKYEHNALPMPNEPQPTHNPTGMEQTANIGGKALGAVTSFSTNHPWLTGIPTTGIMPLGSHFIQNHAYNVADDAVNKGDTGDAFDTDKINNPEGLGKNFNKGFLQGSSNLQDHINNQTNPNSMYNKSWGSMSVDNQGNINRDLTKVPGYALNRFEGWAKEHPWITGIGGGLALTGILSQLFRNSGNTNTNNQPTTPPQSGQAGWAPNTPQFVNEHQS